jgi:hypothetical protein
VKGTITITITAKGKILSQRKNYQYIRERQDHYIEKDKKLDLAIAKDHSSLKGKTVGPHYTYQLPPHQPDLLMLDESNSVKPET